MRALSNYLVRARKDFRQRRVDGSLNKQVPVQLVLAELAYEWAGETDLCPR